MADRPLSWQAGDPRSRILRDPTDPAAAVKLAEALYLHDAHEPARTWLRRARRLAPGWGVVLHSGALAARRVGARDAAAKLFQAEAVVDPRAVKALARLADDLIALGRVGAAGRVCRWLMALGVSGAAVERRAFVARLTEAGSWEAVGRTIETMSPAVATEPAVTDALWAVCGRLPGAAAAAAMWRTVSQMPSGDEALRRAADVAALAVLSTEAAVVAWNAWPAAERRKAAILVLRRAPGLRPLAEAALAAAVEGPDGSLLETMRAAGTAAVDVGARGLPSGDAPLLPAVATAVAIDADGDAIRHLSAAYVGTAGWHDLRPVVAAVGERAERRCLHLTRQPGLSSLLVPDLEVGAALGLADGLALTGMRPVETMPLAAVLQQLGVPPPSHLKLDTQGTELEILRGAEALVRDHLLSIQVEAEFRAIYRGQPLFGEVDRFLVERGFEAVLLRRTRRRLDPGDSEVPSRLEIGWCHALYMRSLPDFAARRPDWPSVVRYCTVAMAYRLTDRALALLRHPAIDRFHPSTRAFARALVQLARQWPEAVDDSRGRGISKDQW